MLGLVAGLGVGAAVFYYRSLVTAHLERGLMPRILMTHADVRQTMRLAQERKVDELAAYLSRISAAIGRRRLHSCNHPRFLAPDLRPAVGGADTHPTDRTR